MTTLTRRKALTAIPAAAACAALPLAAFPAQADDGIYKLIEDHKAAFERFGEVIDLINDAEDRFRAEWDKDPVLVPAAILPTGEHVGSHYDAYLSDREQLLKGINEYYEKGLAGYQWMQTALPDQAKVAEATLRGMKRRAAVYIKKKKTNAEAKAAADRAKRKSIEEFEEAEESLAPTAGAPECVWTGRRIVSLLWRDDPIAAEKLASRVHNCWINPDEPTTAGRATGSTTKSRTTPN